MKIKIGLMLLSSVVILAGCQSEVTMDNRMKDSSIRENALEYDAYRKNIVVSEYSWYSKYINQYLLDIKEHEYKVNDKDIKSLIMDLEAKINEIKSIDEKKIMAAIDKEAEDVSKNDKNDKKYKTNIKNTKNNISSNKEIMLVILKKIREGLRLGEDGQFDSEDIKQLEILEESIIKFYEENLKPY